MDVAVIVPGVWRWTAAHPAWVPEDGGVGGWDREVASYYAEMPDAIVLVDPIVPEAAEPFWRALDRDVSRLGGPLFVCVTAADHERSAAVVAGRYRGTRIGPGGRVPDDGQALTRGLLAHRVDPAGEELAYELQSYRALVVGDVLIGTPHGLRLWPDTTEARAFAARMSRRKIDHVLTTHGPPALVHGDVALAEAAEAPVWGAPPGAAS
jgi:hypothetical protein